MIYSNIQIDFKTLSIGDPILTYLYGKYRNFKSLECGTIKSKWLVSIPDFVLLYCFVSIMNIPCMHQLWNKKEGKVGEQHIEED